MNGKTIAHWSTAAIEQLRDLRRCPLCRAADLHDARCPACGAVLAGEGGVAVWRASTRAAEALGELRQVLDRLPREQGVGAASRTASPAAAGAMTAPAPEPSPAESRDFAAPAPTIPAAPGASTTLQSVLAVAGAGLVALAALVFTVLNPDLSDPLARGGVLIGATLLFAIGAPALTRRALTVSAECVAALALVFATLAIVALEPALPLNGWSLATGTALLGGAGALVLGLYTRVRGWMLAGSFALALVPILAAAAIGTPPATLWGPLGTAAVALALLEGASLLKARGTLLGNRDRWVLIVSQLLGAVLLVGFIAEAWVGGLDNGWANSTDRWLSTAAAIMGGGAIAARSARHGLRWVWSFVAGASVPAALVVAALAIDPEVIGGLTALIVILPTAAAAGVLAVGLTTRADTAVRRGTVFAGAVSVLAVTITPHAALATFGAIAALFGAASSAADGSPLDGGSGVAVVLGLMIASAAIALYARLIGLRAGRPIVAARHFRSVSLWVLGLAGLGALGLTVVDPAARAVAAIVLVTATAVIVSGTALGRRASLSDRLPIVLASHVALLIAASMSWQSTELAVTLGPAVLVGLASLARTAPTVTRPAHTAIGFGYALVLIASALAIAGVGGAPQLSITTTIGLLVAIAATFTSRIPAAHWITVLVVASAPFALAVGLVVLERNGWVALSTTAMVVLAASLLGTRRAGLGIVIRALAAAVIVPSIAVILVNLGAELLVMSGSPIVLPAIALVVGLALPLVPRFVSGLRHRGMPLAHAAVAGRALEASALLTGVIAVTLAYVREAAGPVTAIIVLAVLALGSATAARVRGATAYWWVSGGAATTALSTLWFELGITTLEAHLLPPTVAAAAIALVLTARGTPRAELYGAALLTGIVPVLALLALGAEPAPARAVGLVLAAVGLTVLGASIRPRADAPHRLAPLRAWSFAAATIASLAGAVQAARVGLGLDSLTTLGATPSGESAIVPVLLIALAGAIPAAVAGILRTAESGNSSRRWALVPAIASFTIAACTAIERDEFTVAVTWMLMLALLVTMTVAVAREQRGPTVLPRPWVLFALALGTAIVAWSTRDFLRVEAFSVPLGLMLLAAGVIAMRRPAPTAAAPLHDWPAGRSGSWWLLAPGIVVLVFASMLATATDPQTWRAVLVMGFALVFILVGVRWRLAAPFVLGIVVLPVENVLAFSVQIGRGIEAMPWWITLAVVGIVLLVIAVGSERSVNENGAPTARLRDLR